MLKAPQSEIRLVSGVSFTSDYNHIKDFGSKDEQNNYFSSLNNVTFSLYSFVRKEGLIRVQSNIEDLYQYNYLMYKNKNKWIYCFITDKTYINENTTGLIIKTDVWQTYQFDVTFKESFVVREHVLDDTIGLHTVDEGFASGDYICNSVEQTNLFSNLDVVVIARSEPFSTKDETSTTFPCKIDNIVTGASMILLKGSDKLGDMKAVIDSYSDIGKLDDIVTIFMFPGGFITPTSDPYRGEIYPIRDSTNVKAFTTSLSKALNGYTPKNNKLYTYPYCYLNVSNNQGTDITYKWENLGTKVFKVRCNLSPNATAIIFPMHYDNIIENSLASISMGDFPVCAWSGNAYENWVNGNKEKLLLSGLSSAVTLGGSIATGNVVGALGGAYAIGNLINETTQAKTLTNKGSNSNGGSNTALGIQDFLFTSMSIKRERAKIIDDYFTRFGYKITSLKVPNFKTRSTFNYIQTQDINITGNIDNADMLEFKNIFDTGTTVWHGVNYLNFESENKAVEYEKENL